MIELPALLKRFITGLLAGAIPAPVYTTDYSPDRTFTVAADIRAFTVAAETRIWTVTE